MAQTPPLAVQPLEWPEAQVFAWAGGRLAFSFVYKKDFVKIQKIHKHQLANCLDYDRIHGNLILRQRIAGDCLRPAGRGCTKTFKNLFQELEVPPEKRSGMPVLSDAAGPVWAPFFGVDERVAVTGQTESNINHHQRGDTIVRDDIEKILLNEESLSGIVKELGAKISEDYRGKRLLMISILKGSVVFMADLMRAITIPCRIDFMAVSSYGSGVKTSGVVKIVKDLDINLEGYDLLIVEDILDSGKTLHYIREILTSRNPKSIRICTLLDKPERRQVDMAADYVGACVPDEFVVGYGLDYDEKYRNLPYVGVLKPFVYGGK